MDSLLPEPLVQSHPPPEEVVVWWGGYSWRALLPEIILTVLLTIIIAVPVWLLLPRFWAQAVLMPSAGLFWVIQAFRWGWRVFGFSYRITTHALYARFGFDNTKARRVLLDRVVRTTIKRSRLETWLNIGRLVVEASDQKPIVLSGL